MSYSKFERGKFIRLRMHLCIISDLSLEKINAEQAGYVFDLMSHIETPGTTHNQELLKNEYYLKAVNDWIKALKIRRKRYESKSL